MAVKRTIFLALGLISLGLAIAGAALPVLPTTPFLILAAYCFSLSSPRLLNWLLAHRTFGPLLQNWRAEGAISRKSKWSATAAIVICFSITLSLVHLPHAGTGALLLIAGCVLLFIWTRPEPQGSGSASRS